MANFNINDDKFTVNNPEDANKPGFIYDIGSGDLSIDNLPDINILADQVINILEYATTDEMKYLRESDNDNYKIHMEKQFPKFSDKFYAMFQKIISGEDIGPLFFMLDKLQRVKAGKLSIEDAEKDVGMSLYNSFVKDTIENK